MDLLLALDTDIERRTKEIDSLETKNGCEN
jgi:hypothetical protein